MVQTGLTCCARRAVRYVRLCRLDGIKMYSLQQPTHVVIKNIFLMVPVNPKQSGWLICVLDIRFLGK